MDEFAPVRYRDRDIGVIGAPQRRTPHMPRVQKISTLCAD
jgi:hypothetical protein